ncbi:hypothetical protein L596_022949 [Steinernema carpocapsae]|uniref:Zinc knuckle domain-containing protein n=2 Tax=Steinernema carpocapsae TaxID=34508 RepID=A0A4U5MC39_STECR|nr:hypothetical protein L596_022949 [Steinernema carpocapsae]
MSGEISNVPKCIISHGNWIRFWLSGLRGASAAQITALGCHLTLIWASFGGSYQRLNEIVAWVSIRDDPTPFSLRDSRSESDRDLPTAVLSAPTHRAVCQDVEGLSTEWIDPQSSSSHRFDHGSKNRTYNFMAENGEFTPLAYLIPPELKDVDPRRVFPNFGQQTPRMTRLFERIPEGIPKKTWWAAESFKRPVAKAKEITKEKPKTAWESTTRDDLRDLEALLFSYEEKKPTRAKETYPNSAFRTVFRDKAKKKPYEADAAPWNDVRPVQIPDHAFLPVALTKWEDDVVFSPDEARKKVVRNFEKLKKPFCGWIPTHKTLTYESFVGAVHDNTFERMFTDEATTPSEDHGVPLKADEKKPPRVAEGPIFPIDCDLLESHWEDHVIFDPGDVHNLPSSPHLRLEHSDLFVHLEDEQPETSRDQERTMELNEEKEPAKKSKAEEKDPFNLSNDAYYSYTGTQAAVAADNTPMGRCVCRRCAQNGVKRGITVGLTRAHSIPAQHLHAPFFPYWISPEERRNFHRTPLTKKSMERVGLGRFVPIQAIERHAKVVDEHRQKAINSGQTFFMRDLDDLSGLDSALLLLEYSEQFPLLLSQPGMVSWIKNYHRNNTLEDQPVEKYDFGENSFVEKVPFLGNIGEGESIQSLENKMFTAPIFRHATAKTDFLLIRRKDGLFIRNCPQIFLVGQQCPLVRVPSPNSPTERDIEGCLIRHCIYAKFWKSEHRPRRIPGRVVLEPHFPEMDPVQEPLELRDDFRLPTLAEYAETCTPELFCAYYSGLSGKQRLLDAGFGEEHFFVSEEKDNTALLEDEVRCAPWNTTRSYDEFLKDRFCTLDEAGVADPSGCGLGISYARVRECMQVKIVNKIKYARKRKLGEDRKTQAYARSRTSEEARVICLEYGVPSEDLAGMKRRQLQDLVWKLWSEEQKNDGDEGYELYNGRNDRINRIKRREKCWENCQKIFDIQRSALSNTEVVSTDEGSSDEDADLEEMARDLLEKALEKEMNAKFEENDSDKELDEFWTEKSESEELEEFRKLLKEASKPNKNNKDSCGLKPCSDEAEPRDKKPDPRSNSEYKGSELQKDPSQDFSSPEDMKPRPDEDEMLTDPKDKEPQSEKDIGNADPYSSLRNVKPSPDEAQNAVKPGSRRLLIYRTYHDKEGNEHEKLEVVYRSLLIDAYTSIQNKGGRQYARDYLIRTDYKYRKQARREKRSLAKLEKQIERQKLRRERPRKPSKPKKFYNIICSRCKTKGHTAKNKSCPLFGKAEKASREETKSVCSACHAIGHIRTNAICPLFGKEKTPPKSMDHITCSNCGAVGHTRQSKKCPFYGTEHNVPDHLRRRRRKDQERKEEREKMRAEASKSAG